VINNIMQDIAATEVTETQKRKTGGWASEEHNVGESIDSEQEIADRIDTMKRMIPLQTVKSVPERQLTSKSEHTPNRPNRRD
jgi:hypothetical protein